VNGPDESGQQHDGGLDAPAVVLPGGGPTSTQGISPGTGTTSISLILPQPILRSDDASSGGLASRLERRLAEDGRFAGLLPALTVVADDETGHVTLTGAAPSPELLLFLLASLRAVPGVSTVEDRTTA
jgi:hypothetical protein